MAADARLRIRTCVRKTERSIKDMPEGPCPLPVELIRYSLFGEKGACQLLLAARNLWMMPCQSLGAASASLRSSLTHPPNRPHDSAMQGSALKLQIHSQVSHPMIRLGRREGSVGSPIPDGPIPRIQDPNHPVRGTKRETHRYPEIRMLYIKGHTNGAHEPESGYSGASHSLMYSPYGARV